MTMTKMKGMGRQASAALASCNCPFLWPFYHSRRTGEIPSLTAWLPNESSGCVYGSQCGYGRFAGQLDPCGFCGRNVHVACMRRHPLLSGWLDKRDRVAKCFDCALYNGVMFETASPAVYKPYYEQIDWRNRDVKQSSLTLGALWALELLTPYGDAGANERCESCNKGGDLLACSFCNVVYHNTPACLGSNVLCEAAIANEDYEWACPKCFKIAVRELIKPKRKPPPPRKRSKRS